MKILLYMLAVGVAVIIARLVDMQVLHAGTYRRQAEEALLLPLRTVPAVRGSVLDRFEDEMVSDEPCWSVTVDYSVLALVDEDSDRYRRRWRKRLARMGRYGDDISTLGVETLFLQDVERMWRDVAKFGGEELEDLNEDAEDIVARVRRVRDAVVRRLEYDVTVREERMPHPILTGLNDQEQIAARELFRPYPWVGIEDARRRSIDTKAGAPFGHILGRMSPMTKELRETCIQYADPRKRYLDHDRIGLTGVERAAEGILRGSRGRFQYNRQGDVIEAVEPEKGGDVTLTIRPDLQDQLYDMFGDELEKTSTASGGAIVVLDVATRECLALVSYPGYDPHTFASQYRDLRQDTIHQPLRFRAVTGQYPPGSIVKPLACLAGLAEGVIDLDTTVNCQGYLDPTKTNQWRCWSTSKNQRARHGWLNATGAIKHSCNIFMYETGKKLGGKTLCDWFNMVGFGKPAGTGLIEEAVGINPAVWLEKNNQRFTIGRARQYAIGQAEVSVTPIQAANLMAVYASGIYRHVTLIREMRDDRAWELPVTNPDHWRAIRQGLYGVVNDSDGTANKTHLDPATGYALCGKTGSAEAFPWVTHYEILYEDVDGRDAVAILAANDKRTAIHDFIEHYPDRAFDRADVKVHARWPTVAAEDERKHSHAWFAGYLQPLDAAAKPDWARPAAIAFAVVVEFGGSGGRTAGPIARKVAIISRTLLGPDLDPDFGSDEDSDRDSDRNSDHDPGRGHDMARDHPADDDASPEGRRAMGGRDRR